MARPMPASVFSSIREPRRIALSARPKLAKALLKVTDAPPTSDTSTASAPLSRMRARLESKLSAVKGRYSSPTTCAPVCAMKPLAAALVLRPQM
ncbi:hypothetical protein D9M72_520500 [compost metagenome]